MEEPIQQMTTIHFPSSMLLGKTVASSLNRQFHGVDKLSNISEFNTRTKSNFPNLLEWVIASNLSSTQANVCKGNSLCTYMDIGGYFSSCNKGYEGNPYLDPGCHVVKIGRVRKILLGGENRNGTPPITACEAIKKDGQRLEFRVHETSASYLLA